MSKTLILMQGVPGSGKSTLASRLGTPWVFSTDNFWMTGPGNTEQGSYTYDPERIFEAHRWNQIEVAAAMLNERPNTIVIDNTNIKNEHIEPYVALAKIFDYSVEVIRVECSLREAIRRQSERPVDRRIPVEVIDKMFWAMERLHV